MPGLRVPPAKWLEEASLTMAVEWAPVERARWRQFSRPGAGAPQLTTMRKLSAENSKASVPAN